MPRYAADTTVPADRSRAEIERTLERYGATAFMYGRDQRQSLIAFDIAGRRYRMALPMPDPNGREFTHTPTGLLRTANSRQAAYEQATRQRWRALALLIKAVLEAAESGITTLETALQPYVVIPGSNQTAGDWLAPQIELAYRTGRLPALLPQQGLLVPPAADAGDVIEGETHEIR